LAKNHRLRADKLSSKRREVPCFGELLNGSMRDWIGMGHENSLEWQRANLRD